jgi:hypothetical protein
VYIAGVATGYICDAPADACQQPNENGMDDAYIAKIDNNFQRLLAATFLGGDALDAANCIVIDGTGNVYVAGWTDSANFPTTEGAYDGTYDGDERNIFVAKFDSNLCTKAAVSETCPHDGDVNEDGTLTMEDARLALLYALGIGELDDCEAQRADMDCDGEVKINDFVGIIRCMIMERTGRPCTPCEDDDTDNRQCQVSVGSDQAK